MARIVKFFFFALFCSLILTVQSQKVVTTSPDQKIKVVFSLDLLKGNAPFYSVLCGNETILAASPLGLEFEGVPALKAGLKVIATQRRQANTVWKPVLGERQQYRDHYNESVVRLREVDAPNRTFSLIFRAYNEGIAIRYEIPSDQPVTVTRELTGFRFTGDHPSWITQRAQGQYQQSTLSRTPKGCERPYVIEVNPKRYVALGEASLTDNARMKFDRDPKDSLMVVASLEGKSTFSGSFSTPWRYVMIAVSPARLLENNFMILNLNPPNALKEVSWIKPGKVIREVTLTTSGAKACIDFAARHRLQYIEFDAGWYGPEYNNASDATDVHVDPARSPGPLALREVIDYGKSKQIGVLLYVNQKALTRQLDTLLPLYRSWGVKGVKYGFVNVGPQSATHWLYEAVRKAADNQLMVDIHDEFRPTGFSRTYPNLVTQEGVRGDEESPDNHHVLITLFTRLLAGPADHTNCYFAPRVDEKMGSHASQMAKAICIYSPWQFIYWYDRPEAAPRQKGGAGSSVSVITEIPDLTFWDALPTVWDETKVLEGAIGSYATLARRNGKQWFVGSLTDQPRTLEVSMSFLDPKKRYMATIYTDDRAASPTGVKITRQEVRSTSKLRFELLAHNGLALILTEQ